MAFDPAGSFIEYRIRVDTSEANVSLSEFRASLAAVLTLMNTIGLPPPFDEAAAKIQRGIALAWAFKTALDALAMSSPYTAVIGAIGFNVPGVFESNQTDLSSEYTSNA